MVTDDTEHLSKIEADFSKDLDISVRDVELPQDLEEMLMVYKPCVSSKIFIHEMFPDDDAGIVIDTDIVVMDDIAKLWQIFRQFDRQQMAALAPADTHYSNVKNMPYYGAVGVGLNAGIMLFNFTRMRNMIGGGFTEAIRFTWQTYRNEIKLMEQDVLNIIFAKSPRCMNIMSTNLSLIMDFRYVYELPCDWNYLVFQCRPDLTEHPAISRQRKGVNLCQQAEKVLKQ